MLTAGVDLAADPAGTAVAAIAWSATSATVRLVAMPAVDDVIVALTGEAVKIGVDCPLGWPDDFVTFVSAHRAGVVPVPEGVDARQWRRPLDAVVAALTARAAVRDQVCRPGERELPAARTEGWIAIPTAALADLPG